MEILQTNNMEKKDIDLSSFLFTFGHQHKTYEGHMQHDCLEFCRVFLDDINKELNEIEKKPKYSEINYSNKVSKILCENEFHNFFEKYEKSLVIDLFYSQAMTTYECKCKHISYNFQKVLDFPLLLPNNIKNLHLKDL